MRFIAATATDSNLNTSEFSLAIPIGTDAWTGQADGKSWFKAGNWSNGIPGAGDQVTIAVPEPLIAISGGDATAATLFSVDAIAVSSGSLAVGSASLSAPLTLAGGGTLKGGGYTFSGNGSLVGERGTASGITLTGAASVSRGEDLFVTNGLNLGGDGTTVTIDSPNGQSSQILFNGTQVLGGGGRVVFTGAGSGVIDNAMPNSTLTIGSSILIDGSSGLLQNGDKTSTITNAGRIIADVSGGTISVGDNGALININTIAARSGGTVRINGIWSNPGGVLQAQDAASTLDLSGINTTGVGNISGGGGTIDITGTLDLSAQPLNLN
jgi:hypothetical protein